MIAGLIKSLRPRQWTKNLLLLAGIVFARQWNDPASVRNALIGFAVFCILSGVVYITNDIVDLASDREHPRKKLRPIASGAVSVGAAAVWAILLAIGSLAVSYTMMPYGFFVCSVIYLALITAYSFLLKHQPVLDILVLAMGFVVRAIAGVEAIKIADHVVPITSYFVLTTLFLALFLAICKRRNELIVLGESARAHRRVLREYGREFLDVLLTVATAGVLFSYALWTTQGQFAHGGTAGSGDSAFGMVFTMPFVIYGIFRYIWLVFQKDEGGAPEMLLLEDFPLLLTVVLWTATTVAILVYTR